MLVETAMAKTMFASLAENHFPRSWATLPYTQVGYDIESPELQPESAVVSIAGSVEAFLADKPYVVAADMHELLVPSVSSDADLPGATSAEWLGVALAALVAATTVDPDDALFVVSTARIVERAGQNEKSAG